MTTGGEQTARGENLDGRPRGISGGS
jgi:hypothetical protein